MVLSALQNMKASLTDEISKVNAWVDQLILNPLGIIPSSQPFDDFGDFALPTTEEHLSPEHTAHYTTAEEEAHLENLYFDLAKILSSSGRYGPFAEEDHCLFADVLSRFLRELKWDLTPYSFMVDQLDHIARVWNARCAEEQVASKHFLERDLFDDLFGTSSPCTDEDLICFLGKIDDFCAYFQKSRPLTDSDFIFIKEFLSCPTSSKGPSTSKPPTAAKVCFSELPITTINTPPPRPLRPLSEILVPGPEEFPTLSGKPFGDT
jgi:hypothetical protein